MNFVLGVLSVVGILFFSHPAHAFPEMVRYGYVNCNSCHVSLTGGGLLNDYGREISREKLALFKSSDEKSTEQDFAYGALDGTDFQKYIKAGGDVRSVYYYVDTPTTKTAQTIFMQGDLEAAYVSKRLTIDGTLGSEQPGYAQNVQFVSRRHYLSYAATDEFSVRAGKYIPAYGINTDNHTALTRDPLQLGPDHESYNLEASYQTENWSVIATGLFGRFDDQQSVQDRGGAVQGSYSPNEHMKLGANVWYGKQLSQSRTLAGPFAMIGLTNKLYFQTEVDFQFIRAPSIPQNGVETTQKLSYELLEGIWAFGQQEYGKSDYIAQIDATETYGFGFQIFPRSHFDFQLFYEKSRLGGTTADFDDVAWFMAHFYL